MAGRPTKLTAALRKKMALLVRAGNTVEVAAQACGISERTFYNWMEQGEAAKTGAYHDFYVAVEEARATFEATHVATIAAAAQRGSWQAAAWLLTHRHPERWGTATERMRSGDEDTHAEPQDGFEELDELAPRRAARQNGT